MGPPSPAPAPGLPWSLPHWQAGGKQRRASTDNTNNTTRGSALVIAIPVIPAIAANPSRCFFHTVLRKQL